MTFHHLTRALAPPYAITVGRGASATRYEPMSSPAVASRAERVYARVR